MSNGVFKVPSLTGPTTLGTGKQSYSISKTPSITQLFGQPHIWCMQEVALPPPTSHAHIQGKAPTVGDHGLRWLCSPGAVKKNHAPSAPMSPQVYHLCKAKVIRLIGCPSKMQLLKPGW